MKTQMICALCAVPLALAVACTRQDGSSGGKGEPAPRAEPERGPAASPENAKAEPGNEAQAPAGAVDTRGRGPVAARVLNEAPPPRLYDEAVERRLHSDRLEASSFLWTDWNRFQENYHPNYLMDGDPKTAWVEGADSSGAGEWVRIHVSPVEGATRVRLRIRNGYHKSSSLYTKNARARKLTVKLLPGGHSHTAELVDEMSWQEIAFDQPAARVEALELHVAEVVEGKKYTDLCISDVEVHVTGLTVENPAFEKAKLDRLQAWKKERLAAARLFTSKQADELPILGGYRVERGEAGQAEAGGYRIGAKLRALQRAAGSALPDAIVERTVVAFEGDLDGWVPVRLVARATLDTPDVDGLRTGSDEEWIYDSPEDAFHSPWAEDVGGLLRSDHLSTFDVKGGDPRRRYECTLDKDEFLRPPRGAQDGPLVRELAVVSCSEEETREGSSTTTTWTLLEFDDEGELVLMITPSQDVTWFQWEQRGSTRKLVGGLRVRDVDEPIERLVEGRAVAAE
jgi:hypothetical protein